MKSKQPNLAAAADSPGASVCRNLRRWRLAAGQRRYMRPSNGTIRLALAAALLAFIALLDTSAQETNSWSRVPSPAPTGTYVAYFPPQPASLFGLHLTNRSPMFNLQLKTNGTYVAETCFRNPKLDGDLTRMLPEVARGTWRWDAQAREFQLHPGTFMFGIRRLLVDPADTSRLIWGTGPSSLERDQSR